MYKFSSDSFQLEQQMLRMCEKFLFDCPKICLANNSLKVGDKVRLKWIYKTRNSPKSRLIFDTTNITRKKMFVVCPSRVKPIFEKLDSNDKLSRLWCWINFKSNRHWRNPILAEPKCVCPIVETSQSQPASRPTNISTSTSTSNQ